MRIRTPLNSKAQARLELQARQHRALLTESEARLWSALKARQLECSSARRWCWVDASSWISALRASGSSSRARTPSPDRSLGSIEVDGGYHARRRSADASRDRKLQRLGYRVVRVDAELVLGDLNAAVELIRAALSRDANSLPMRE